MTDPSVDRPGSSAAGRYHASPIPPSPRPSVASRASRSSLRRESERQETPVHQAVTLPLEEEPAPPLSPPPPPPIPPSFSPLFALLTSTSPSSNRQTTHHPTVHYVFADDDPEILTAALAQHHRGAYGDNGEDDEWNGPNDRAVILDMEPSANGSGLEVAWASSLTPDWAVTSACVSRMEGGGGGSAAGPSGNLALHIQGVSLEPSSGPLGKTPTPEAELQSSGGSAGRQPPVSAADQYADLLQAFERRMVILRKVVEAGAARQRALPHAAGQFSEGTVTERVTAPLRSEMGGDVGST